MKYSTSKYLRKILIALSMILFTNCSNDDDATGLGVEDIIILNVDENPTIGQSIGVINATSNSPMTFLILEQTFINALAIDPNTGELTVRDASFFDFETNPIIQGVLQISNGTETVLSDVRVELNNTDDIAFFLTESKQDYIDAQAGDWVEVTETEYNNLALSLNGVSKIATSDGDYNNTVLPSTISSTGADNTIANNNGMTMPSGSYLFAFKYISGGVTTAMRAKQSSTSITEGYENIGNVFPMSPASGTHYLVLKSSIVPTVDIGYLAIYSPIKSFRNYPSAINNSGIGDTNMLPDLLSNNLFLYQGLSTTQKQWD